MTLPAQNPSQSIVAVAAQTVVPFTWRADTAGVVSVYINDVVQGGYAIALNADQVATPGGTVTLPPLNVGDIVTVERVNPQTQTVAFNQYGTFPSVSVSAALDRVVQLLQEFSAKLTRAMTISRANLSNLVNTNLPTPQAGGLLAWAKNGAGKFFLTNATIATGTLGAAVLGQPLQSLDGGTTWTDLLGRAPSATAVYLNGERIFPGDDYTYANGVWILLTPADPTRNKLNADLFL